MFCIPILEELVQILTQMLENIKGQQVKKMTLLQNEITELEAKNNIGNEETRVIGFQIPEEDEEEYVFEEDD